jgi:hypothetical protein
VVPARLNRDTTGPIARTVTDAALLLQAMAGFDPRDNLTSLSLQVWAALPMLHCREHSVLPPTLQEQLRLPAHNWPCTMRRARPDLLRAARSCSAQSHYLSCNQV